MKKVLFLAAPLVVFSGMAFGAAPLCSAGGSGGFYDLPTLTASGFACEVGSKVFYNFGGSFANSSTIANGGDSLNWTSLPSKLSETMFYNVGSSPFTISGGFTFTFSVSVDPAVIFPGNTASIASLAGSIQDSNVGSNSTLTKVTTPNVGSACTVTVTHTGGNGETANVCNYSGATSLNVSETFAYTSTAHQASGFQNTITEALSSTTGAPEPVSMLLFGSGLLAVGFFGRKRFSNK